MSTLNTFGFNVRRRRNHDTTTSTNPDKAFPTSDTSSLAFAATSPQSINTHPVKTVIKSSTANKLKATKQHSQKERKQSSLLPYFAASTTSIPATPSIKSAGTIDKQGKDHATLITQQQQSTEAKGFSIQSHQTDNEEIQQCRIRRSITPEELMPRLEEAFDGNTYDSMDHDGNDTMLSDGRQPHDTARPLLQVKMNKVIYVPAFETDDDSSNYEKNSSGTINQHRRRSHEHEIVNKRPCLTSPGEGKQPHVYSLMDEFDTQQQDDVEITVVRRCLSAAQMGYLLLDIANEFLTFDNNNWCISYFSHPFN